MSMPIQQFKRTLECPEQFACSVLMIRRNWFGKYMRRWKMNELFTPKAWWRSSVNNFPNAFKADQSLIEENRLKSLLTGDSRQVLSNTWVRLRRAATLLEISALEKEAWESQQLWEIVALIHEAIGVVEKDRRDYQWLLSALSWQLAGSSAIARLLAEKLSKDEAFRQQDIVEQISVAFSQRNFLTLRRLADLSIETASRLQQEFEQGLEVADAVEVGMLLTIGRLMRDVAEYVNFSYSEFPDLSVASDFLTLAKTAGDARRFRVGRLLFECVGRFASASSRLIVENIPNLTDVARKNIQEYVRHYPELWPSQRDAIEKGLLDNNQKHFVVAVPTSSGKTLCGEMAIIHSLTAHPDATCFYVVPTRALVEEKSKELRGKLGGKFKIRVVAATSALQQDEIEASLLAEAQVVVCTPEKLDLLVRHNDESLNNAALFIIDESHMIDDDDRGLGLEFVVIKLLLLKPGARMLLLSAMLPNSEDFGRWLSKDTPVCSSSWRPTRQRFGEIEFRKLKPRGAILEMVLYGDSGSIDDIRISIDTFKRQPSSIAEKVILAVEAFRSRGPVLVFCMSKSRCEEIVEKIVDYLKTQTAGQQIVADPSGANEVENLRHKIRREVADNFLLSEALAFGVAYHHADLPPRIRIDLENLITGNSVDIVVSTTTLAEGVNLPISTVIYEDWMTHVDPRTGRKSEPLDLSKFRNIAGRAGRPGKEAEGLILFLDPSRKPIRLPSGEMVTPREHFIRQEYPSIQSRFLEIVEKFDIPENSMLDAAWENGDSKWIPEVRRALQQFGIAVLHAIEVLGSLGDDLMIEKVIDLSLLAVQRPEAKEKARQWFGRWVSFYRRVGVAREELRPIAMQVGLPLRAVQQLYARAISRQELIDLFHKENAEVLTLSLEQTKTVANIVAEIEELDWQPETAPHSELIVAWISGKSIGELGQTYTPHLPQRTRPIERTCNYTIQQLSNKGSWGAYALARVLELILGEELSPLAKRLPLFVYFGVNSTPAALLCLMGIERIDAHRLGRAFIKERHDEVSIASLKSWAKSTDPEILKMILRGHDEREIDYETLQVLRS
jgi:superfamily II DNA/RNA helicase